MQVDSTWGLPDGLSWLPHDQFWVNTDSGEVRRSTHGKTSFLDVDPDGVWAYRETPTEWIWRSSLFTEQARAIAVGSRKLALQAGRATSIMWFTGLLDPPQAAFLPWVEVQQEYRGSERPITPSATRNAIKTLDDLALLEDRDDLAGVLLVVPDQGLVRDSQFVERIGDLAVSTGLSIEILGSPLAHPYYMLRARGIAVSCPTVEFAPGLNQYNKLVRDDIVSQIHSHGETVAWYQASDAERTRLLRMKVIEEALEVARADSRAALEEEVADLQEVIDSLVAAAGLTRADIEERRAAKRRRRGGFDRGVVLLREVVRASEAPQGVLDGLDAVEQTARPSAVHRIGDTVVVSLIPPIDRDTSEYSLLTRGVELRVKYKDTTVEITIEGGEAVVPSGPLLFE